MFEDRCELDSSTYIMKGGSNMYNHQLDTFIKVADAGSFSKASEQLYISTNAVMKQINSLEGRIGTPLFHRTYKGYH